MSVCQYVSMSECLHASGGTVGLLAISPLSTEAAQIHQHLGGHRSHETKEKAQPRAGYHGRLVVLVGVALNIV